MRMGQVSALIVEDGASADLASHLAGHFGAAGALKSILLITDRDLMALGLARDCIAGLEGAGYEVTLYPDVSPDPPDSQVVAAAAVAQACDADLVIGFGGGSVMDVAKVAAVLATGDQPLEALYGVDQVRSRRLPLVQIPTTAGTGSEVTNVAIITTVATTKSGIVSPVLYADMAVLDPVLTHGLPPHITAATGIDAMVHAIEAFTSKRLKNPLSDALALQALKLIGGSLVTACRNGDNSAARRDLLVGAMLAGQAFSNAPVAAVHALAYPLGGHFHISHGLSNALVLPHVLAFNMDAAEGLYAALGQEMQLGGGSRAAEAAAFLDWLETIAVDSGAPRRMRDVGIGPEDIPLLAAESQKQERLLINNPKPVNEAAARAIYEAAW